MKSLYFPFTLTIILVTLGFGIFYFGNKTKLTNSHVLSPAPTKAPAKTNPTLKPNENCSPSDLNATVDTEGAAGNIYGTLKITNISNKSCQIAGSNLIDVNYDKKNVHNISLSYLGTTSNTFELLPKQSVYSQVHYPNGAQCSKTRQTALSFTYQLYSNQYLTFKNQGNLPLNVNSCVSPSEDTEIQLWYLSNSPISQ